jgi:hypothetical protein
MRVNMWNPPFAAVLESPAKTFAVILEGKLRDGMCRLRLGGYDTFMVFQRAWREATQRMFPKIDTKEKFLECMDQVITGLRLLKEHHPYGAHIESEKIIGWLREDAAQQIASREPVEAPTA